MVVTDETFDQLLQDVRLSLRNIRCEVAGFRVYLALKRLVALTQKSGLNPDQLRKWMQADEWRRNYPRAGLVGRPRAGKD